MTDDPAPTPDEDPILRLMQETNDAIERSRRARGAVSPPDAPHGPTENGQPNHPGDTPADPYSQPQPAPARALQFLLAQQFMEAVFEPVEALLGQPEDTLLCTGSTLMVYGKGGAGKTTFSVDAMCHLAAGIPWLGQDVLAPVKIELVENEGPLVNLQQRLITKRDGWDEEPWWPNVDVFYEPQHKFNLRDEQHRQDLADRITWFEAALVIVGPLATIGSIGAGTLEDVAAFEYLIDDTKSRTPLDPAFWFVHHENKAGNVSGAWDRWPDTVLHLRAQDNGRTRLEYEKTRWSTLQGTAVNLLWTGTYSFTQEQPEEKPTDEAIKDKIKELFNQDDRPRIRSEIRDATEAGTTQNDRAIDELVDEGWLHQISGADVPGRSNRAKLFTTNPTPRISGEEWGEWGTEAAGQGVDNPTGAPIPTEGGGAGVGLPEPATNDPDHDIPF